MLVHEKLSYNKIERIKGLKAYKYYDKILFVKSAKTGKFVKKSLFIQLKECKSIDFPVLLSLFVCILPNALFFAKILFDSFN